jgi:hypothetical protein
VIKKAEYTPVPELNMLKLLPFGACQALELRQQRPTSGRNPLAIVAQQFDMRPNPTTGVSTGAVYGSNQILCGLPRNLQLDAKHEFRRK